MVTGKDILALAHDLMTVCDKWKTRDGDKFLTAFEELSDEEQANTAGLFRVISIVTTGYADVTNYSTGDLLGQTADHEQLVNLMTATDPELVSNSVFHEMIDGLMRHFKDAAMLPRRWHKAYQDHIK